jgi:predicted nucleic acid-binding protein
VLVVDASVLVTALSDDALDGDRTRARLRAETLAAPDLVDIEFTSTMRGLLVGGKIELRRAELALADLAVLPLERVATARLVPRCWELRDNLSAYDAAYVALAEALGVPLLTADARLAWSTGPTCDIELVH